MLSQDHARSICMENGGEVASEAAQKHPRMLEWLLSKNYIDVDSDIHDSLGGTTKLLGAAIRGVHHSLEASKILIRAGADVNAVTKSAKYASALIIAARPWQKREVIQFLVEEGADISFVAESGEFGCALEASIRRGESEENAFFLLEKVTNAHLTTTFSVGRHGSILAAAAYWARRELLKAMVCRLGQEAALETLRQSLVFKGDRIVSADEQFKARRKGMALFLKEEIRGVDDELLYKIGVLPEDQYPYIM
ncbi:hypothetical protein PT974_03491 [Cladobotryum mycophilum]|uniref:Uncharacterized protein n=1 Tax=Cladobotryum mycophilum TaxID=491253 RepID=A0ABR0SSH1_9HYPO